ncbi:hypothetical protein V2G26_018508 [Clonostachys chloroleuca]
MGERRSIAQLGCSGTVEGLTHVGISSHARSKMISPWALHLFFQRVDTTAESDVSIEELGTSTRPAVWVHGELFVTRM